MVRSLGRLLPYALPVGVFVLQWLVKALRDGKVSKDEIFELIEGMGMAVGIPIDIGLEDTQGTLTLMEKPMPVPRTPRAV